MSWIPTLRIARAAWKGSKDPVGTIKAQLIDEQPGGGAERPRRHSCPRSARTPFPCRQRR